MAWRGAILLKSRKFFILAAGSIQFLLPGVAIAQVDSTQSTDPSDASSTTHAGAEILVEASRLPVVKTPTEITPRYHAKMLQFREYFTKARMFVRCLDNIDPRTLRTILDGPPHKASTIYAQGLLIATHIGCHLRYSSSAIAINPAQLGKSIYDRGALLEYGFDRYASNLSLSRRETEDPVIQRRFNIREAQRNRWRLASDYLRFEIAVCMVRIAPELSVRLTDSSSDYQLHKALLSAIIGTARICVGNAKKVTVDPTQFRVYIMDAVWRWAEAARNVDSLIPLPEGSGSQ